MNAIYGITVELDRTARASRVNRLRPGHREPGQSRGRAASVKRSRPDNVKNRDTLTALNLTLFCYNTVRINSIPRIFRRLLLKKSEKEKLNLNACGYRTLKCDATQPIIRY